MCNDPMIAVSTSGRRLEIPLRHFLNASGIPVSACTIERCTAVYLDACRDVKVTVVDAPDEDSIAAKLRAAVLELVAQIMTEEVILGVVSTEYEVANRARGRATPEVSDARIDQLTPRERQVFELLVRGASSKGIARSLGISARTVEFYRARISSKLNVKHITDLVRIAVAAGIGRIPDA